MSTDPSAQSAHPISLARGTLLPYLAAWSLPAGLLTAALGSVGALPWTVAPVVALPLALTHAFICLGAYYVCRTVPVQVTPFGRLVATQLASAVMAGSLLAALARGWVAALAALGLFRSSEVWHRVVKIAFAQGVLLFVVVAAFIYVLEVREASRRAENEALRLELLSRDAELRSLRAQIHPHFLFNSLNSINALIGLDATAARRTCLLLADFLRTSLALGGRDQVTVAEEVALASQLLAIEKVRLGERLEVAIDVEDGAAQVTLPPLLLQPLVENAIKHGVGELIEGGRVSISARLADGLLVIEVLNPRDPLAPSRRGTGLGLQNVARRVTAAYGRDGQTSVQLEANQFRVTLRLPKDSPNTPGTSGHFGQA